MTDGTTYKPKFGYDIRIKPPKGKGREPKAVERICEWEGCEAKAAHKAPKGKNTENEYYWFCLEHVREYNRNWNYFEGMSDNEARDFQEQQRMGGRPTWKFGTLGSAGDGKKMNQGDSGFTNGRTRAGFSSPRPKQTHRRSRSGLSKRQLRAFEVFDISHSATAEEIRDQYKLLVKKFHPDANGGDQSFEARLREVIEAYQVFKSSGFC